MVTEIPWAPHRAPFAMKSGRWAAFIVFLGYLGLLLVLLVTLALNRRLAARTKGFAYSPIEQSALLSALVGLVIWLAIAVMVQARLPTGEERWRFWTVGILYMILGAAAFAGYVFVNFFRLLVGGGIG